MNELPSFVSGIEPPKEQCEAAWWFVFLGDRVLVRPEGPLLHLPLLGKVTELGLVPMREHFLGQLDHRNCHAVEVAAGTPPSPGMIFEGLRQVYGRLGDDFFWIATRAVQIIDWDRTHQFCSRCAAPMRPRETERAKECPECGLLCFPRLAPAIIVLVERGDRLLLARSRHFAPGVYSVIAGFVEPGETLEEAVVREVHEETGIFIKNIHYFGSQPWPFPHSLMIGFTATYAGGEISLQDSEIEDAAWFAPDNLPTLPGYISIARKLIEWFLAKERKGSPAT